MYDVDGNGVIDIQEMTKIVQVIKLFCGFFYEKLSFITHKISRALNFNIIIDPMLN